MAALSHWQLPAFKDMQLEDSFVVAIKELGADLRFDMDFVVNERHRSYRAPSSGEDRCYRRGRMTFRGVSEVKWLARKPEAPESDEPTDLGKVDAFIVDGGVYKLNGEWGSLELRASSIQVDVF